MLRSTRAWRLATFALALIFIGFNLRMTQLPSEVVSLPASVRMKPAMNASRAADERKQAPPHADVTAERGVVQPTVRVETGCASSRQPYHVLLTASSGPYQAWQSRIFYYHYLRLKKLNPCSDIGGFTRLLTLPAGKGLDELAKVMRTVTSTELKKGSEDLGFVVLNRPHSLRDVLRRGALDHIEEEHVLIAETDHILLKPIANVPLTARSEGSAAFHAVGYPFHYMMPRRNPQTIKIVARHAGVHASKVQQVGPSPVLLPMKALHLIIQDWLDLSFALKRDPEADAEFNWMLEMWGYSIACAKHGVEHTLPDTLQLEPSSQFGVTISRDPFTSPVLNRLPMEEATHNILHYTFSHEYSYEGVPMIDTIHGEWRFDKRAYQKLLPRSLKPPPACALESTWVLWRSLHDAMASHSDWPDGPEPSGYPLAPTVAKSVSALRVDSVAGALALRLVGSGPWEWGGEGPVFFMRGGFLGTPWGTARWGASEDGKSIVIFMCSVEAWSHSATLLADDAASTLELITAPPKLPVGTTRAVDEGTHGEKSLLRLTHGASLPSALNAGEREDALAALAANEQAGGGAQGGGAESSTQLRQRLLGTGPWRIGGVGDVYFLARGVANVGSHVAGTWRVEDGAEGGERPTVVLSIEKRSLRFRLSCWRLLREDDANIVSEFVWQHAAKRCFPTCSEATHPITSAELQGDAGGLARRVTQAVWSWGLNREGVRFSMEQGEGVLITPWGHGTWGLVHSRKDVLLAEFAQQRHMLRFFEGQPSYVSTRCNDGDLLAGEAMRPTGDATSRLPQGWWDTK